MGLHVTIIPARPEATVLRGTVGIDGCKVLHVPEAVSNLDGAFVYDVRRKDGVTQSQVMADGVSTFARFDEIAPTMAAAVLTTEDGGFWKHDGFLRSQFEASLRRNVEVGRIKRGASTLTMQMVKNLLLSHERTLSRKIQELFLTWVIEKRLSKKRILEIYLNAVEFGPGIYGVVSAAQHYFGKLPADLNGKEAAFLATMLPSPVRRHDQWCRGAPTPAYAAKVDRVFKIMHDRKRIDDLTWELDRDILLEFSPQEWPGERACRADDAALLKADGVQWAESGLLAGRSTGVSALTPEDLLEELPEE
jgi:membrane peptidoglycan carboxypeptidase